MMGAKNRFRTGNYKGRSPDGWFQRNLDDFDEKTLYASEYFSRIYRYMKGTTFRFDQLDVLIVGPENQLARLVRILVRLYPQLRQQRQGLIQDTTLGKCDCDFIVHFFLGILLIFLGGSFDIAFTTKQ